VLTSVLLLVGKAVITVIRTFPLTLGELGDLYIYRAWIYGDPRDLLPRKTVQCGRAR
jgi:hypothetical protein